MMSNLDDDADRNPSFHVDDDAYRNLVFMWMMMLIII